MRKCLVREYVYVIKAMVVMLLEVKAVTNVTYSYGGRRAIVSMLWLKLRTKPRHSKFKAKLREQKQIEQAKVVKILYHRLPSSS